MVEEKPEGGRNPPSPGKKSYETPNNKNQMLEISSSALLILSFFIGHENLVI